MSDDSGVMIKGSGVLASVDWMRTTYGDPCWRGILSRLPREDREMLDTLLVAEWIPVEVEDRRWRAFVDSCHPHDPQGAENAFVRMGQHIAQDNLRGVYQLASAVLKPESLIQMVPRLFDLYAQGVEVEVVSVTPDGRDGRFVVRNMGGLAYLSPTIRGWIECALGQAGVKDPSITEKAWDAGEIASDELQFRVVW